MALAIGGASVVATVLPAGAQNYDLDRRDDSFRERLEVIEEKPAPVIGPDQTGLAGNKSGFETGVTVKVDGTYHLFISEMFGRPHLDMRIAHWSSPDSIRWTRQSTVVESKPGRSPNNSMSEVWMQAMVFDEQADRWTLFYIAYRGGNSARGEALNMDYEGVARRAVSQVPGRKGIGGPFKDVGIAMAPGGKDAALWEGQQGLDSFFPYRVGNKWVALHGSHNHFPVSPWQVGVATAPRLTSSTWKRVPSEQPSPIESLFIENPIVNRLPNGHYIAVYDNNHFAPNQPDIPVKANNSVGYSISRDGIRWHQGRSLIVQTSEASNWSSDVRTALGLVPEPDGTFTLLYTGRMKDRPFWGIGRVRVKLTMAPAGARD
ncbi:hypothetical protein BFL28_00905 [Sphingomonas turrisvirgatae]|uniref:Glycosyl hydrolase family 32 N-terminal domain-containing protein n=2 Tax=Sphingomonas turrisvirgatae TaxID=1888892 RepID=A0A1E3LY82_9SPHN|nr:hypothetical protein BFL28_00905 [Sphingomonas turrisvirgatae]